MDGNTAPPSVPTLAYSVFPDLGGKTIHRIESKPWAQLVSWIETQPDRKGKHACPLVKLASFGQQRSEKGSLRNDDNVIEVFGVEGDYDAGEMTPEQAAERLESFGLRATIYTSWSHTPAAPKWRVLVPLSRPVEPSQRLAYAETLNGMLGGVLAPESGVLSQSYFVGRQPGADYKVLHTFGDPEDGFCLDEIDGIQAERVAFRAKTDKPNGEDRSGTHDDYLAELLDGADVHANALRIVGRLVREGFSDSAIKTVFAGLALQVAAARGRERADELTGSELQRMIDGARAKGYERETPADDPGKTARIFTMVGDLIANAKPPQWLIRDQLELDALALLWGQPKTGKSFIAIDWACSVATGTPCFGSPTRVAPVFYICGEGHNGLSRRFLAWSLERGVSLDNAPIAVSNRALPLTHPGSFTAVSNAVAELREITGMDPGLIVVDTLARNFGANENDTEAMSLFITHMDGLRAPFKATALIVHHSGKDESRGPRGNLALFGAVDASYKVARDVNGAVNLYPEVIKDGSLPPPQNFNLIPRPLPIETPDGSTVTSCTLSLIGPGYEPPKTGQTGKGKNQTKALRLLQELYDLQRERVERSGRDGAEARVLVIDWRESCLANDIDAKRFSDVRKTLSDSGKVAIEGLYVYLP